MHDAAVPIEPIAAAPSSRIGLVGFGASHINAITQAFKEARTPHAALLDIAVLHFRERVYKPLLVTRAGKRAVNDKLDAALSLRIEEKRPPFLFCSLLGGTYAVHGLVNHPQPFRIFLPASHDACGEATPATADVIPFDVVAAMFERKTETVYTLLAAVMEKTRLPIYQICPPPPIGEEEHIRQRPGTLDVSLIDRLGIAPPALRRALWLALSDVMRRRCRALGVYFIEPPAAAVDEAGYLRSAYYSTDPIHANSRYGDLVLHQLAEIAGA
jgi:hypothetical protein